jgi:hypothetical protein
VRDRGGFARDCRLARLGVILPHRRLTGLGWLARLNWLARLTLERERLLPAVA